MFNKKLDDIVLTDALSFQLPKIKVVTYSKLILHQVNSVLMELIHQGPRLFLWEMLEASLQHTTAIRVPGKVINVSLE